MCSTSWSACNQRNIFGLPLPAIWIHLIWIFRFIYNVLIFRQPQFPFLSINSSLLPRLIFDYFFTGFFYDHILKLLKLGNGASSDSSDESEEEEEVGEGSLPGSRNWSFCSGTKKKSKKFSPPTNPYRSAEELEQYRRHFDHKPNQYDEDELREIIRTVPTNFNRQQIYEFFARRTKSIHGFRLIPCPDWSNSNGSSSKEPFYIKDRNVCRYKIT